jgi:hypothetical protein
MQESLFSPVSLVKMKDALRAFPKGARQELHLTGAQFAMGYHALMEKAPSRRSSYRSSTRTGILSTKGSSNREEEHLAAGLYLRSALTLPCGEPIRLIDYQTPLKSVRTDAGIGKIDLLAVRSDHSLAIIELKVDGNVEDRRIALLESLIYAAIVEANAERIAEEFACVYGHPIEVGRPSILIIAPPGYWNNPAAHPARHNFVRLVDETAAALAMRISLLQLEDCKITKYGADGRPPVLAGCATLANILPSAITYSVPLVVNADRILTPIGAALTPLNY